MLSDLKPYRYFFARGKSFKDTLSKWVLWNSPAVALVPTLNPLQHARPLLRGGHSWLDAQAGVNDILLEVT